jgi:hypothetical protein
MNVIMVAPQRAAALQRPWADLDPGLLVVRAVVLRDPGVQAAKDHLDCLVEPLPRLVHVLAHSAVLALGQSTSDAEAHPPGRDVLEHRHLLDDPQRVVPGQDDRARHQVDRRGAPGQVGQVLHVVPAHAVALEVVLDAPDGLEPESLGLQGHPDLVLPGLMVRQILVPVLHDLQESEPHDRS